jgi:prepilin-type N-terminal cleavage/methylation domain-containing protein
MKKAFTLIELLVVIAIIAILAAILFPVFAQAKLAAKKTSSISNEKQIALGLAMYEGDVDDQLPQSQYGVGDFQVSWAAMIYPYIRNGGKGTNANTGILQAWAEDGIYKVAAFPGNQSFNYGVHLDLFPDNWGTPNPGRKTYSNSIIDAPADKVLLVEKGRTEDTWGWCYFSSWEWDWTAGVGMSNGQPTNDRSEVASTFDCDGKGTTGAVWAGCGMHPRYRYANVGPMQFADGHVKAMAKGSLKFFKNIYVEGAGDFGAQSWYPY